MQITQRVEGEVTVFLPEGRIDAEAAGKHKMVMDMSGVDFIVSAGLRVLAAVQVRSRAEGGDMKVACLNERMTRVFDIIGADIFMSIHDTPEAAIADFTSSAAS